MRLRGARRFLDVKYKFVPFHTYHHRAAFLAITGLQSCTCIGSRDLEGFALPLM
jgi:hypothetical protein